MRRALLLLLAVAVCACGEEPDDPNLGMDRGWRFWATSSGFVGQEGPNGPMERFVPAGVNFGLATPGTFPGEFAATREQIARWIEATSRLGANTIRVYTVQSPAFYEELRRWNLAHPDAPLFLLQGAWLREPEASPADYLSEDELLWFRDELEKIVDVVYGARSIPPGSPEHPLNWGRAHGDFTADVSPWLLGWLIGREVEPHTLRGTYELHPERRSHRGVYFSLQDGDPIEALVAESFDYLIAYEEARHGRRHPIAFSNWPTLDPLDHPTEPPYPISSEDLYSLDVRKIEVSPDFEEGVFVSYHAYPYYPDFIVYQPDYQVEDRHGPNSYLGYLRALRRAYEGYTLVVSEIGFPSSQGSAKRIPSGLDHGGMDEVAQGRALVRALESVRDAGMDGFCVFSLIDEWFKRAWIVDPIELPAERRRLWHNVMSPEQNFGLIALRPGSPERFHFLDGEDDEWRAEPLIARAGPPFAPAGDGLDPARDLIDLTVEHDEGYLHVRLRVEDLDPLGTGDVAWDRLAYWLVFDTVDPERGARFLDPDQTVEVGRKVEFVLRIEGPDDVTLWVDRPYDLYGIWHGLREPWQAYRSVANEDGVFHLMRNLVNWEYVHEGVQLGPFVDDPIGVLPTGHEAERSDTNFVYAADAGVFEIRIPWSLLHVSDPSSRQVIDGPAPEGRGLATTETPGIAIAALAFRKDEDGALHLVDSLPAAQRVEGRWRLPGEGFAFYAWEGWDSADEIRYHEAPKASYWILQDALPGLLRRSD